MSDVFSSVISLTQAYEGEYIPKPEGSEDNVRTLWLDSISPDINDKVLSAKHMQKKRKLPRNQRIPHMQRAGMSTVRNC